MQLLAIPLVVILGLGDLYWIWMAIQLGSFWMFVIGVMGPVAFLTGAVGVWSFFFEPPTFIYEWFG
tara:strand:+ start:430 stop:627 length:198 start_codon:yes stop_codon:yes gene_type:complete